MRAGNATAKLMVVVPATENGRRLVALLSRRDPTKLQILRYTDIAQLCEWAASQPRHPQERTSTTAAPDHVQPTVLMLDTDQATADQIAEDVHSLCQQTDAPILTFSQHMSFRTALKAAAEGAEDHLVVSSCSASDLERRMRLSWMRSRHEAPRRETGEPPSGQTPPPRAPSLSLLALGDVEWTWNLEDNQLSMTTAWHELIGSRTAVSPLEESFVESVPASTWLERIHPDDRDSFRHQIRAHLRGRTEQVDHVHRLRLDTGGWRWVRCRGRQAPTAGDDLMLAGLLSDHSADHAEQERLAAAAMHDPLTGLANRSVFLDRVGRCLSRSARRSAYQFAVLFLDVDRFKAVNDSLGHAFGDKLLRAVSNRLEGLMRPTDFIGRIGGDEFAILVDEIAEIADATRVARRVLQSLAAAHEIDGKEVYSTVSIGVAVSGPAYSEPSEMLRDADNAMYRAKTQGRARYQVYDPTMHEAALRQLALESDLRRALIQEELAIEYQPIVELATGEIEGFEALLRWNHPERGLLGPDEFIRVAEETGAIHQIGHWVLDGACRQAAEWQERFPRHRPLTMSVNISGREFLQDDLVARVCDTVKRRQLIPGTLRLELTETSLMEHPEVARQRIEKLRQNSVGLHLDDFGTGYCSLSYLQKLPTDTLKIDRSFIGQIQERGLGGHILETIVSLAHRLGMSVSAEGLETEAQVATLRNLACRTGQGFYFSEAVAPAQAETLLHQGSLQPTN